MSVNILNELENRMWSVKVFKHVFFLFPCEKVVSVNYKILYFHGHKNPESYYVENVPTCILCDMF